ncbi:MAG: GNAT family N-acetyltransferase [Ilumatobacteraceae bacterium]
MFPVVDDLRSIEFGTPGNSRENLVNFIINGNKRATAGLAADYEKEGEEVEFVGECLSMVNTDGNHVATLQVTRVDTTRFADVPDEFALAEAEGDLNAVDFRASHMEYWTKAGESITDDTMINQIYFTLLTHRLRNLESSDAEWIYQACQDEEVQRWTKVPRPYTREHAESFIKNKNGELAAWAIVDFRSQEPVGMIGIHHVINGVASIGYWVAPWGRKSGAASTVLQIIPTLARRIGKAHTLHATIAETNTASRRTAERAGFSLLGNAADMCPDGAEVTQGLLYEVHLIPAHH